MITFREFKMTQIQAQKIIADLYQAVDKRDIEYLEQTLSETIRFRIGNNPVMQDKKQILEANQQFFNSIQSMRHTIEGVVYEAATKFKQTADKIVCHGQVDYVRLDGTSHSAVFSTLLQIENKKITNYLVFADLSAL